MKRILLATLLLSTAVSFAGSSKSPADSGSQPLIEWGSAESTNRFEKSQAKADFFKLSNNFESQNNGLVCGLASSTIVLNAMRVREDKKLPVDRSSISPNERKYIGTDWDPYLPKFTQENVVNSQVKSKLEVLGKPRNIQGKSTKDFGFQLRQLAAMLESHGAKVVLRVADNKLSDETIKTELINNLKNSSDYVLVNYKRSLVGQKGGGHISPLGAYDKNSDSFLVMDVNPNKAPWVWMPSRTLIEGMRSFDTIENRGYLLISEAN